jgi:hypothetical protein
MPETLSLIPMIPHIGRVEDERGPSLKLVINHHSPNKSSNSQTTADWTGPQHRTYTASAPHWLMFLKEFLTRASSYRWYLSSYSVRQIFRESSRVQNNTENGSNISAPQKRVIETERTEVKGTLSLVCWFGLSLSVLILCAFKFGENRSIDSKTWCEHKQYRIWNSTLVVSFLLFMQQILLCRLTAMGLYTCPPRDLSHTSQQYSKRTNLEMMLTVSKRRITPLFKTNQQVRRCTFIAYPSREISSLACSTEDREGLFESKVNPRFYPLSRAHQDEDHDCSNVSGEQ